MICADYRGDSAARQELDSWGAGPFQAGGSRAYAAGVAGRQVAQHGRQKSYEFSRHGWECRARRSDFGVCS